MQGKARKPPRGDHVQTEGADGKTRYGVVKPGCAGYCVAKQGEAKRGKPPAAITFKAGGQITVV